MFSSALRLPALRSAAVLGLASAAVLSSPGTGHAATTASVAGYAAGAPRFDSGRGAVDVGGEDRPAQLLTRSTVGAGQGAPGDEFGRAIAREEVDGKDFLAIGAPGAEGSGAVYLTVDSPRGFGKGQRTITLTAPDGASGDRFGETVLISRSATPFDTTHLELWVGAPRRDVGGAADAGAVERYRLTREAGKITAQHVETLQQGSGALGELTAEAGDRFGEVLAPRNRGVIVGVPHEDVGAVVDAGMATFVGHDLGTEAYSAAESVTQDSPGVPDRAESGDRFGAALAPCGTLIGVPGEDVGSIVDAGLVQTLNGGCFVDEVEPGRAVTQESAGVPGHSEAGDRFGEAVTVYEPDQQDNLFVIGVPGEDVGRVRDAGSVVWQAFAGGANDWYRTEQGGRLPGTLEPGDALGSSLHTAYHWDAENTRTSTEPLIGAPGEDLGDVRDAGAAYEQEEAWGDNVYTFSPRPVARLRFGTVFATQTYGAPDIE